ncbi:MAG: PASTA domain-containing protein [Desulfobacterales bacterium]|nr:PASTA domain-containing protein [Desulfobacterales bacterium]
MIIRIIKILTLLATFIIVIGLSAYFTLTFLIKSEDTVVVPKLIEKDVVYVLEVLTDLGLNTKVGGSEYSSTIPKNHIVYQDPDPGVEIKKGRDVKIIISKGTETILMPDLKGLSIQQAGIVLEENGLIQGQLTLTYNQAQKKDDVIAQVPSPGITLQKGERVNLLLSLGPRPKTNMLPELEGLTLGDAILLIEKNNLVLGEIKSFYQVKKPKNIIVGQEPLAGYRVLEGSRVNLVINRKYSPKDRNVLSGSLGVRLFRYRLENGFLKRRIRIRLNCFGVSNDLFDDFMKPGEEIWLLIPGNNDATVFLYEDDNLLNYKIYNA